MADKKMSNGEDIKRMILGGIAPKEQPMNLKVAAPINDVQLVSMIAASLMNGSNLNAQDAVANAYELFCQANAQFSHEFIVKRINEIKEEINKKGIIQ
jgi:hypothetical protein